MRERMEEPRKLDRNKVLEFYFGKPGYSNLIKAVYRAANEYKNAGNLAEIGKAPFVDYVLRQVSQSQNPTSSEIGLLQSSIESACTKWKKSEEKDLFDKDLERVIKKAIPEAEDQLESEIKDLDMDEEEFRNS